MKRLTAAALLGLSLIAAPAWAGPAPQMEIGKAEFYLKEFEKEVARAQGADMGRYYNKNEALTRIKKLAMDGYRWTLISDAMIGAGWDARDKNKVKLVRPSDIMKVEPVVQRCFDAELFSWGDYPPLRWATNNAKRIPASRGIGSDTGNFYFGKIEAKSRKTDPFMALVASMVVEPVGVGIR